MKALERRLKVIGLLRRGVTGDRLRPRSCAVDMRVGRVTAVDDFPEARKPAWKLDDRLRAGDRRQALDGADHELRARGARGPAGRRPWCNFPPRQIGPFSVRGARARRLDENGRIILLEPDADVARRRPDRLGGRLGHGSRAGAAPPAVGGGRRSAGSAAARAVGGGGGGAGLGGRARLLGRRASAGAAVGAVGRRRTPSSRAAVGRRWPSSAASVSAGARWLARAGSAAGDRRRASRRHRRAWSAGRGLRRLGACFGLVGCGLARRAWRAAGRACAVWRRPRRGAARGAAR